ncbi:hypothetical protein LI003_23170, partial [Bacteroides caccae]|nr:hypothetical protein [Bacteroides caccae]
WLLAIFTIRINPRWQNMKTLRFSLIMFLEIGDLLICQHQQPANSREIFRKKNGITEQQYLLLQVGSDFTRKGVDRSIEALASLP